MWNSPIAATLLILLSGALLFGSGCNHIPPGTPPDGAIVQITIPDQELFWPDATHYLATSLIGFALEELPPSDLTVAISGGVAERVHVEALYNKCRSFIPLKSVPESQAVYKLLSRLETIENHPPIWHLELRRIADDQLLWSDRVGIAGDEKL